jgi:N-acetylglucosaminyldiphosphoundecaprenol N-acetyl-beta-D-mannosaminyltransferase
MGFIRRRIPENQTILRPLLGSSIMTQRASDEGEEHGGDHILFENEASAGPLSGSGRVWIFGIPIAPLTMVQTVQAVCDLIEVGRSAYIITANTHYAMLSERHVDLRVINKDAAFIIADGAPLVWASRWAGRPLPERVAGSDLIFELSSVFAQKGFRLFLLGGADGVAAQAGRRLCALYPGLQVVGTECPSLEQLGAQEQAALIARIRAAKPDILFVAFGQPKGERWIHRHLGQLIVPVSIQVGASLDFAAGMIRRAPRWMQKVGLEWAFRVALEPRRLFWRYADDAWFLARVFARYLRRPASERRTLGSSSHLRSPELTQREDENV